MKLASVLSAAILIAAIGCKGGEAAVPAAPAANFAAAEAVLTTRCKSCHSGPQAAGGVALDTYEGVKAAVTPGDPKGSRLIRAMRAAPGVRKMPPNGPPATEQEIQTVEAWIQAGANNPRR